MSVRDEILCFSRAEYAYLMQAGRGGKIWGFAPQQEERAERPERVKAFVRLTERGLIRLEEKGPVLSEKVRRMLRTLENAGRACLEEYAFPDGMRIRLSCCYQETVVVQEPARGGREIRMYERTCEDWQKETEERLKEIKSFVSQQGERLLEELEAMCEEEAAYAELPAKEWEQMDCHMRTLLMRRMEGETQIFRTDRIFDGRSSRYLARMREKTGICIYTQESASELAGEWAGWIGRSGEEEGQDDFS